MKRNLIIACSIALTSIITSGICQVLQSTPHWLEIAKSNSVVVIAAVVMALLIEKDGVLRASVTTCYLIVICDAAYALLQSKPDPYEFEGMLVMGVLTIIGYAFCWWITQPKKT